MATNLATAQGRDTFLLDFIGFAGLSRLRSPSRARLESSGNVEKSMFPLFYFAYVFGDKWGQFGDRAFLSRFSSNVMMFSASFGSGSPGALPELNAFVSASYCRRKDFEAGLGKAILYESEDGNVYDLFSID